MDGGVAWLGAHSYAFVLVATAIDATAVPFPGRVILVAAGMLAAAGRGDVIATIAAGVAGAVAGDHLWYFGGRLTSGRLRALYHRVLRRRGRRIADPVAYLRRHGSLTIVIGRFVALVRVLAWPLASAHGIGYFRFLAWDLVAATLWVGLFVLGGFVFGRPALAAAERLGEARVVVPVTLAAALLIVLAVRRWRRGSAPSR